MDRKTRLKFIVLASFLLGLVSGLIAQSLVDAAASAYAGAPGNLIALVFGAIIGLASFFFGWRVTK